MVARNCTLQDLPYARLLHVSEEDREFLALDELKPHQLTELSGVAPAVALASENGTNNNTNNNNNNLSSEESPSGTRIITERQLTNQIISEKLSQSTDSGVSILHDDGQNGLAPYGGANQIYYDLNTQQTIHGGPSNSHLLDTMNPNPFHYLGNSATDACEGGWAQQVVYNRQHSITEQQQHFHLLHHLPHEQQQQQQQQQQGHHNHHHQQQPNPHHTPQQMHANLQQMQHIQPMRMGDNSPSLSSVSMNNNHSSNNSTKTHQHMQLLSVHSQGGDPGNSSSTATMSTTRKRKGSYTETNSDNDDDGDNRSVRTADESKKQNHSEIEKRRRDKMNTYILELSTMVPMCHAMSRKLDKLTVLRMAVQHLKIIRGAVHSYTEGHYKPAFLSDQELKALILQAADGFMFVVGCDRGRILYVSESVQQVLNYRQGDLLGQSWFDILHPKDVAKVKEQLSSLDLSRRERLIDAKTMLPVKTDIPQGLSRLCPGARRSFFCRMKYKSAAHIKEETDNNGGSSMNGSTNSSAGPNSSSSTTTTTTTKEGKRKNKMNGDRRFCVIHCTGYLKSWAPAKMGLSEEPEQDQEQEADGESSNLSCLVAVGRIPPNVFAPPPNAMASSEGPRTIMFLSRHAMDGQFLFVDQRATLLMGFLPQELLTTNMYEYFHHDDIPALAEAHKSALQGMEKVRTCVYRMRAKDGSFICVQSEWRGFRNPWTKDVEYMIAKNYVVLNETKGQPPGSIINQMNNNQNNMGEPGGGQMNVNFEMFTSQNNNGRESMQRMINSHVEASKIGREIAEKVLEYHRRCGDHSSESSPDPDGLELNAVNPTMPFNRFRNGGMHSLNPLSSNPLLSADPSMVYSDHESSMVRIDGGGGNGLVGYPHSATSSSLQDESPPADNSEHNLLLARSSSSETVQEYPRRNGLTLPSYGAIRGGGGSNSGGDRHSMSDSSLESGGMSAMELNGGGEGQLLQNAMEMQEMGQAGDAGQGDGNDEGAMAVIMSLLEADAGLGGPVDFTGLPWPLP